MGCGSGVRGVPGGQVGVVQEWVEPKGQRGKLWYGGCKGTKRQTLGGEVNEVFCNLNLVLEME